MATTKVKVSTLKSMIKEAVKNPYGTWGATKDDLPPAISADTRGASRSREVADWIYANAESEPFRSKIKSAGGEKGVEGVARYFTHLPEFEDWSVRDMVGALDQLNRNKELPPHMFTASIGKTNWAFETKKVLGPVFEALLADTRPKAVVRESSDRFRQALVAIIKRAQDQGVTIGPEHVDGLVDDMEQEMINYGIDHDEMIKVAREELVALGEAVRDDEDFDDILDTEHAGDRADAHAAQTEEDEAELRGWMEQHKEQNPDIDPEDLALDAELSDMVDYEVWNEDQVLSLAREVTGGPESPSTSGALDMDQPWDHPGSSRAGQVPPGENDEDTSDQTDLDLDGTAWEDNLDRLARPAGKQV